jgi:hypothetical protein
MKHDLTPHSILFPDIKSSRTCIYRYDIKYSVKNVHIGGHGYAPRRLGWQHVPETHITTATTTNNT